MTARCALYLRSSKDRHDVSIDAQRRELVELARARGLTIAAEFSDVVVSGATENRPGWQALLLELRSPTRTWKAILALDTARIARNQWIAHGLRHECKKRGVDLIFAKTPELDGIAGVILPAVLHAMDEVHSMLSREKGLAGMAENVRRGHRAGGRAPIGYRLERIQTGAIRDGEPVTKSRLKVDAQAPAIARYLKGRAAGEARARLARDCGLEISPASLIGVEWNALTYAGATVWNARDSHGKRKPRGDWMIQPATHEALISQEEAELILGRLERQTSVRMKGAAYLLSGILVAPDGRRWHGDGDGCYRCGRRRVSAAALERAVLEKLAADLTSEDFVRSCLQRARDAVRPRDREAELKTMQRQIAELERKAGRIRNLLPDMRHPQTMIRELDKLEDQRLELERRAAAAAEALAGDKVLLMISEEHVRAVLRELAGGLDLEEEDARDQVKAQLRELLEQIELEPERLTCRIDYAIPVITGDKLASPREPNLIPGNAPLLRARRLLTLLAAGRQRLRAA
jgi:site-specific DNA recombinase